MYINIYDGVHLGIVAASCWVHDVAFNWPGVFPTKRVPYFFFDARQSQPIPIRLLTEFSWRNTHHPLLLFLLILLFLAPTPPPNPLMFPWAVSMCITQRLVTFYECFLNGFSSCRSNRWIHLCFECPWIVWRRRFDVFLLDMFIWWAFFFWFCFSCMSQQDIPLDFGAFFFLVFFFFSFYRSIVHRTTLS